MSGEQLYCSIDLELTGFDPAKDEILEVGFLLFKINSSGIVPQESWSQVFKPKNEVRSKIFALTGITKKEVENAPDFNEFRKFLVDKLAGTILVGHSIGMDIRFLESFGVPVTLPAVDTLSLAQVVLPTHHSYNLENLTHYLGIKIQESHRALADATATAELLVALLGITSSLSLITVKRLQELAVRAGFAWANLLGTQVSKFKRDKAEEKHFKYLDLVVNIPDNTIVNVNFAEKLSHLLVQSVLQNQKQTLLVLAKPLDVLEVWKEYGVVPLINPNEQFNAEKFNLVLSQDNLDISTIIFLCKVLVWQELNWQTQSLLDINTIGSGVQGKSEIVGGELSGNLPNNILVTDYATFKLLSSKSYYTNYSVVIEKLGNFAEFVGSQLGTNVSWHGVLYTLKSIYNPETDFGATEYKNLVLDCLAATDLFFGLINVALKDLTGKSSYIVVENLDPYVWGKIVRSANHYEEKLTNLLNISSSEQLQRVINNFHIFFEGKPGFVRWIEIFKDRCSLVSKPLQIVSHARNILEPYKHLSFCSVNFEQVVSNYYQERLGLSGLVEKYISTQEHAPVVHSSINLPEPVDLVALITADLPTVVCFQDEDELKQFYDSAYRDLKYTANVFALGYTGGPSKLIRNFSLRSNSILLATPSFLAKYNYQRLQVKTLVFYSAPIPKMLVHPYLKALAQQYKEGEGAFADLLFTEQLNNLLEVVYSQNLESIYVFGNNALSILQKLDKYFSRKLH